MKIMDTKVKRLDGRQRSLDMETLIDIHLNGEEEPSKLFKYVLPEWQRDFCWTEEQQIRFIESCYLGYSLGSVVVNSGEKAWFTPYDKLLIDGQQRLTTIKNYLDNRFPVFGCYFDEVWNEEVSYPESWYTWQHPGEEKKSYKPKNHFRWVSIPMIEISTVDEAELKELYIRMNYGGTAHTENDLKRLM